MGAEHIVSGISQISRNEAGPQRLGDIAAVDRAENTGLTTPLRGANGDLPAGIFGASLVEIFRCARPEA